MYSELFAGSLVALVTPFANNEVDEAALRKLVRWHIEQGTQGIVPVGTTGESPTLTEAEHKRVVSIVVEEAKGDVPVIAGACSNNPVEAVAFAQYAQSAGADAVLCVAGYYNRPSQEGLYQHFRFVHDNTDLPIIVYNIPPRAIVDITPETMASLAELPRIAGVKDATAQLARVSQERHLITSDFSYLSGEDMTAVGYNAMGGNGCISVTANVAPNLCAQLQKACAAGDYESALRIHERLVPLHAALFAEPSPAGIKYAMSLRGLCLPEARLPIVPLGPESRVAIEKAMQQLELVN